MTIREALKLGADSEILLAHVLNRDKAWLFANPDKTLSKSQAASHRKLVQKRRQHWPVAYLTGHKEFYGLDFKVAPDVLIPRPETELLVDLALLAIRDKRLEIRNVIDIGTGSGCIITALAVVLSRTRRPVLRSLGEGGRISGFFGSPQDDKLTLIAIDNSAKALRIARINARRHGVASKIQFVKGNLLSPIRDYGLGIRDSLILANLPYLTPKQANSNPDLKHEPRSALAAGKDGLKYYRELFKQINPAPSCRGIAPRRKAISGHSSPQQAAGYSGRCWIKMFRHSEGNPEESQGSFVGVPPQDDNRFLLLLEHDPSQVSKLKSLAKKYFPNSRIKFHKDLSDRYRAIEIEL